MFTNGLNFGLPLRDWFEKAVHGMETHRLFGKEKVPRSVNKVLLTVFNGKKGPIMIDFLEKGAAVNSASYYQFFKFTHNIIK